MGDKKEVGDQEPDLRETGADPVESREESDPESATEVQTTEELVERLRQLEEENARLAEERLRVEAELVNYRRRAQRDREEAEASAKEQVLGELLRLADDLERALDAAEQQEKIGPIFDGVKLVHGRVRDILAAHEIEIIDPRGEIFDPHEAEALMEVDSEEFAPGRVVDVIERGYRYRSKLLRPAKVTVARAGS